MDEIERIWTSARNRAGEFRDRRRPSAGIAAVLVGLLPGPEYVHELARESGQDQGNVSRWLLKLDGFEFVTVARIRPGIGGGQRSRGHGGARPAVYWRLTLAGRELAGLLAQDVDEVAA